MGTVHADAVRGHPGAEVTAVASRTGDTARRLAERCGARALTVPELIESADVDLVCVTTPDHLHADIVEQAAKAGKHVIVEKPFTTSVADADRALEAVRVAGVTAMVLFNHRWVPAYAQAKERIAAGDIGTPRLAYARKNDTIDVPTQMLPWAAQTTCAWFLSSHDIDLVCWLFDDRVASVYATCVDGVLRELDVDTPDAIQAQVRFASGGVATFESCWVYPQTFPTKTDSFVEVVGTDGVIHLDRKAEQIEIATARSFEYPRNLLVRTVHGVPAGAVRDAIWHVLDCIRHGREPLISLESSQHVTSVLAAIHESIATGTVVELSERS
jgi:predicted dehydrogenase